RARKFRDLKVSEKELPGPSQIDEPVRQIQAAELIEDAIQVEPIIGRGGRRRTAAMPEAAELYRSDPDVPQLIEETSAADPDQAAQSS
ncbi:MAG TPA: DNA recombination protein RmuC, partial [Propionibacteriaceae bacterium]|nr:DNA recombination protein RmuC [Propionibacteriaceae bacterium]